MELESYIRSKRQEKGILLMTHVVLGYPSFSECFKIIEAMVKAGVDLMEKLRRQIYETPGMNYWRSHPYFDERVVGARARGGAYSSEVRLKF